MRAKPNKQVAIWLYCGAITIIIQIILGGITRLTGSGLSITEWQPLLGTLPPMNTAAWQDSFDKYKEIAQFKVVNPHFTLEDYKSIFFWEWLHRNWARFIGLVFLIPFIIFLIKNQLSRRLFYQLIIIFLLGLLQAVIGWIMVKSGLNDTSLVVNEVKLAIHFIAAIILLCYILWIAFHISIKRSTYNYSSGVSNILIATIAVIFIQLFFGGLMAGSKAALAAVTWPDMNGYFIPPDLYQAQSPDLNAHLLWIQFIHRMLAYGLIILVSILYIKTTYWRKDKNLSRLRLAPLIMVWIQAILGVVTLLNVLNPNFKIYAILHQFVALILLAVILLGYYLCSKKNGWITFV
ncbi:COX15/CtaA family protein [Pedobacter sp. AW31-3R]|uniref:COX15/CtaA family protein n=1 Tax=Pedobacter sp. AW31-3R TaxID=3445781 RepID=UPI003FA062C7